MAATVHSTALEIAYADWFWPCTGSLGIPQLPPDWFVRHPYHTVL